MLFKLAFKNAAKSFRDYAVYFFTLVLGVGIFYMFNSIYAQQAVMNSTASALIAMESVKDLLSYFSAFAAVILGFLIVYSNNFFIKRRKKELGVYLTLGMSRRDVSLILVLETSLIALVSLAVGLLFGVAGSQVMSFFTAKLFEADLTGYKFIFSADAALKSVIYFVLIFLVVIFFNIIVVSRVKLIDLIYGGRRNEKLRIKSIPLSIGVFAVSLISLAVSYCLILRYDFGTSEDIYLKISVILGGIGTFLFFFSLAGFLIELLQGRKKLYYKSLNMFAVRQLSSKINSNFITVSVACIALFLVIVVFSSGYSAQDILSNKLRKQVAYDISVDGLHYSEYSEIKTLPEIFNNLPKELQNSPEIKNHAEYALYKSENKGGKYGDYDLDCSSVETDIKNSPLYFMTLSDFNGIREIQGLSPMTLSGGKYIVAFEDESLSDIARQFASDKISVPVGTNIIHPEGTLQRITFGNRYFGGVVLVIEDNRVSDLQIYTRKLNINCVSEEASLSVQKKLKDCEAPEEGQPQSFAGMKTKIDIYAGAVTDKATVSFLAIYLGFVFMIACASVLAVQQLSEAADNKERYALLRKLGADEKELNKALFCQILTYFALPLSLAVVHSAVGLKAAFNLLSEFGSYNIISGVLSTAVYVVVIYGAYFALTYFGSKNIIKSE